MRNDFTLIDAFDSFLNEKPRFYGPGLLRGFPTTQDLSNSECREASNFLQTKIPEVLYV